VNTIKLDQLLTQYEHAIRTRNASRVDQLSVQVEQEADRIGFDQHGRLLAVHQSAEIMFDDQRHEPCECNSPHDNDQGVCMQCQRVIVGGYNS